MLLKIFNINIVCVHIHTSSGCILYYTPQITTDVPEIVNKSENARQKYTNVLGLIKYSLKN